MKVKVKRPDEPIFVTAQEMKPWEVGIVSDTESSYNGTIVLKGPSKEKPILIDLSNPREGECWTWGIESWLGPNFKIQLLPPGTQITFTVE